MNTFQLTSKHTVLVVDDTPESLRFLAGILQDQGYEIRLAPNGQVAIQSALTNPPDLILLDINMPQMDGYEVCEILKGYEHTKNIPIIFISALYEVFDKIKAFSVGGVDYITKPFQGEEIIVRVATHIFLQRMQKKLQEKNHLLQQEIEERKRIEHMLAQERSLLEQRVKERTATLSVVHAELYRAVHLKDEFLASISHELRTPLNAILGLSDALMNADYGQLTNEQCDILDVIAQSGQRLLNLVNDILDFSCIEAGKVKLSVAECSIDRVGQACMNMVAQDAQHKNIQTTLDIDNAVTTLFVDERRLRQMLLKLLQNAVKFTPEGGSVGLQIVGDTEQQTVRFTVWDNGIGIAQEHMQQLFKPFMQLDRGMKRQYGGIGLGLALVYRLAEKHGGSIQVDSVVGKGSRFTISLPWYRWLKENNTQPLAKKVELLIDDAESQSEEEFLLPEEIIQEEMLANDHGETQDLGDLVLLVEDNEHMIQMVRAGLIAKGYRVNVARNGIEALERVYEEQPAIIVMNLQIPSMDGLELIRQIRLDIHIRDIPIIVLTSLVLHGDCARCFDAGANEYMSKPVSIEHLEAVISFHIKTT